MQKKTQWPVQFEISEQKRDALTNWIHRAHLKPEQLLFPSRVWESPHLSTRQYSRIYRRTRNLRGVQLSGGFGPKVMVTSDHEGQVTSKARIDRFEKPKPTIGMRSVSRHQPY